ncbi:hypothetical protein FACS1894127_2890 [Clostridia bacterium]|nr:hypothetical protein FACS1894127_2890 [Clostridia bacterium]
MRSFQWASGTTCSKCGKLLSDNASKNAEELKEVSGSGEWGVPQSLCEDCADLVHKFDRGFSCAEYGSCKHIVHGFKYGGRAYYGEFIADAMFDRICGELPPIDLVLPVPMYPEKEKKRGYNQADVIGRSLAKKLGLPYDDAILKRERNTGAMSGLKSSDRAENIRGAFRILPHRADLIRGKRLLLTDDIYTTGSTINECADVLKTAGASEVDFIVFAVGSDSDHKF